MVNASKITFSHIRFFTVALFCLSTISFEDLDYWAGSAFDLSPRFWLDASCPAEGEPNQWRDRTPTDYMGPLGGNYLLWILPLTSWWETLEKLMSKSDKNREMYRSNRDGGNMKTHGVISQLVNVCEQDMCTHALFTRFLHKKMSFRFKKLAKDIMNNWNNSELQMCTPNYGFIMSSKGFVNETYSDTNQAVCVYPVDPMPEPPLINVDDQYCQCNNRYPISCLLWMTIL